MHRDTVNNLTGSRQHTDYTYYHAGGRLPEGRKSVMRDYNPDGTLNFTLETRCDKNGHEMSHRREDDTWIQVSRNNCNYEGKAVKYVEVNTNKKTGEWSKHIGYPSGETLLEKQYKNDKGELMTRKELQDSSGKVYKHTILNEATGEEKDMLNSNEK